ncbi:kinetochore-associated protein DSN1 homolog isoform X2 [Phyllobates terribilis]|uniref:kinetochore-associated protein DSN1 homolog isoform X2 n=1 Tax=Phyllobates terribilis TaxID=111132 RepID=UPI003CCAF55A
MWEVMHAGYHGAATLIFVVYELTHHGIEAQSLVTHSNGMETGEEKMETTHVSPTRSSPRKNSSTSPCASLTSPAKRQKNSLDNLSFKESSPSPREKRKSLRRSVGMKRRTLPPIYHNATELSEAISLELPESQRLSELLQSCFEFSLRKLETSLSQADAFSAESFNLSVMSVKEKFKCFVERLYHRGTFQRCTEKLTRYTTESNRWVELLENYKEKAVVLTRHLEEIRANDNPPLTVPDLPSSQDQVLQSRPDYSAILHQQGAVFDCMEIVMDNLQQSINLLNSFLNENTSHLHQLSTQLKSQSFNPMEDSPIRTFLKVCKK